MDMSTPDHPSYGQHMQGHEVQALLKPEQAANDAVLSWLQDHNITSIEDESDWVNFVTDVGTANQLLDTEFQWFHCEHQGKERLRTLRYSVPKPVAVHINLVQPTTRFGNLRPLGSTLEVLPTVPDIHSLVTNTNGGAIDPACNTSITPQCLLQLYNVHYKADPHNGNKLGYASYLEEYARYNDLALFEQNIATYAQGENFSVVQFHGGLNDQASANDSGEANLDNQYEIGVGWPVPVTEFSTGGRGPLVPDLDQPDPSDDENEPYLDYLQALLKLPNQEIPQVLSHSYGEDEQVRPNGSHPFIVKSH
jgi:tripeptidyl-peptidase I